MKLKVLKITLLIVILAEEIRSVGNRKNSFKGISDDLRVTSINRL